MDSGCAFFEIQLRTFQRCFDADAICFGRKIYNNWFKMFFIYTFFSVTIETVLNNNVALYIVHALRILRLLPEISLINNYRLQREAVFEYSPVNIFIVAEIN